MKKRTGTMILSAVIVALLLVGCGAKYEHPADLPFSNSEWQAKKAEDAIAELREAGFTNIVEDKKETWDTREIGKIEKVLVDGSNLFGKGKRMEADTPIKITYNVLKQFEPTMDIEVSGDEGKPVFIIKTNLPYKTKLRLTLSNNDDYDEQQTITVREGEARSKEFTDVKDLPLAEDYTLTVVMDIDEQDSSTKYDIGVDGVCLVGPLVERNSETGKPYVFAEYEYKSSYTKAEVARYKDQLSMSDIITALQLSLAGNYGSNYEVKDANGVLTVSVWNDGVAAGAYLAQQGSAELLASWDSMTENMITLSESVRKLLDTNGYKSKASAVNVVNDANHDNVLLTINDGSVVYDYVHGIDLAGMGN